MATTLRFTRLLRPFSRQNFHCLHAEKSYNEKKQPAKAFGDTFCDFIERNDQQ
jgi:hypothetical protein